MMMMNLTAMVAEAMVKQAYSTYSYTASMSRYYHPKHAKRPELDKSTAGEKAYYVNQDPKQPIGPKWGKNKPGTEADSDLPGVKQRLHSFSPTISGTGYGKRYWDEPRNPYM